MKIILALLVAALIFVATVFYISFAWGYVASVIYSWFILPIFPDLPHFTWIQLAGIMFFVNCFVHSSTTHAYLKDEIKDKNKGIDAQLAAPWILLLGAWLFKNFIL